MLSILFHPVYYLIFIYLWVLFFRLQRLLSCSHICVFSSVDMLLNMYGRHCVRHCGMNFTVIILLIPFCELYETGFIFTLFYSEEIDSTNGTLGTESAAWRRAGRLDSLFHSSFACFCFFGVMFRNAFYLWRLCKCSMISFDVNYGYMITLYLIKCFIP